jgi:hypothetical protein
MLPKRMSIGGGDGYPWNKSLARGTKRCIAPVMLTPAPRFRLAVVYVLIWSGAIAAADQPAAEFGKDVQLAPFVVKGQKLSIAIHARTKGDRKYAEEFAEDVVGIAYETMDKSTGAGLVIIGREGEPHPVIVIRKFLSMAAAGQLDPAIAQKAGELEAMLARWKTMLNLDQKPEEGDNGFKITFDMVVPALPLALEGIASKLYQLSWAEGFDDAKIDQKLRALTLAGLEGDTLAKYDWVFYLPPRDAYVVVQDEIVKQGMAKEKMGLLKRAAIRSALVLFKPAVKKAVEGFRKGMLFMTVLQARSGWDKADIKFLTQAYVNVLMPDFKFNGGTERPRALEAIEKQKVKNAEYAKDPFVSPARLATFDPASFVRFEGDYGTIPVEKDGKPGKPSRALFRTNDAWHWQYRRGKPTRLYPAGDRLFVSSDGKLTVEVLVDGQGAITGAEERRERYRQKFSWPAREEIKK